MDSSSEDSSGSNLSEYNSDCNQQQQPKAEENKVNELSNAIQENDNVILQSITGVQYLNQNKVNKKNSQNKKTKKIVKKPKKAKKKASKNQHKTKLVKASKKIIKKK